MNKIKIENLSKSYKNREIFRNFEESLLSSEKAAKANQPYWKSSVD